MVAQLTPVLINGNVENQVFYCKTANGEINIENNGAVTAIKDLTTGENIDHNNIHLVVGHEYLFSINKNDVPSGQVKVTVKPASNS